MSFGNTKTPLKPEGTGKYQAPLRACKCNSGMEYYLTEELKEKFRKLYPVTMNPDMMRLFGVSHSTLHRFARELGLVKNMKVIRRKLSKQIKATCTRNGYYASIRGKALSPQCYEAARRKRSEGFNPTKRMKEISPRRYKAYCDKLKRNRLELEAEERKRVARGLPQKTSLHRPQVPYTRKQLNYRFGAVRRGYILGDIREQFGERFIIYYDAETQRGKTFERNIQRLGFEVKRLIE